MRLVLLVFLFLSQAHAVGLPRIIRIERKTPVFEAANPKSKAFADLEVGALMIGRELSPRKSWILVEDEDGKKGWIPTRTTNYSISVERTQEELEEELPDRIDTRDQEVRDPRQEHTVGPVLQLDYYGARLGLQYSGLPQLQNNRARRVSWLLYFQSDFRPSFGQNASVAARTRVLGQQNQNWLVSGPHADLGYRFSRRQVFGALGYSLGVRSPDATKFSLLIVGTVEWGGPTRHIVALEGGYAW